MIPGCPFRFILHIVHTNLHHLKLNWNLTMPPLPVFNLNDIVITKASYDDLKEILFLQKRAFVQEAEINNGNYNIEPIRQSFSSICEDYATHIYLKATVSSKIIGSVRSRLQSDTCFIGRLVVEPIFQKFGIGALLLSAIEKINTDAKLFELFTAETSPGNVSFYKSHGYIVKSQFIDPTGVPMLKFVKENRQ